MPLTSSTKFDAALVYSRVSLSICSLLLAGCLSASNSSRDFEISRIDSIELTDTPFYSQTRYHCGPAALATVLNQTGIAVEPHELTRHVYLPGREGSLQAELLATARQMNRIPVLLQPDPEVLTQTLEEKKPVLVLQNLGTNRFPFWHYAVLIGYGRERNQFILRSGTTRRKVTSAKRFLGSWKRAGNWAVVLLKPGEMVASVNQTEFLNALSDLEQTNQFDSAISGYQAATVRWPDSDRPWVGMGNAYYSLGNNQYSEMAFRRAITINPDNLIAYNNLATVLSVQGCNEAALDQIEVAKRLVEQSSAYARIVNQTYQEILSGTGNANQHKSHCSR